MENFEDNDMLFRHSSMMYVRGRPLDLGLEGKDGLNHCEGKTKL